MSTKQRTLFTVAICLCTAYLASINSSHGALLSSVIGRYGLASAQQGLPNSMQNVGCLLALISSLWIIGRISKEKLLLISMAGIAAIMLPLWLLPPFSAFVGLFALAGVAFGYIDAVTSALIADIHKGKNATRMMCLMHAVHGLSGIVSPLALGAMMGAGLHFRWCYMALFAMGVAVLSYAVPTVRTGERLRGGHDAATAGRVSFAALCDYFKKPLLRALMGSILLYGFFLVSMIVWISRYVEVSLGSNLGPTALALLYLGLTASRLLVPLLKVEPVRFMKWSNLASGALLGAGLLMQSAPMMCASVLLCSLASGSMIPVTLSVACGAYADNTLLASTLTNLMMLFGNCAASPAIGAVEAVLGLRAGIALCAGAVALSGAMLFLVRPARAAK